MRLFTTAALIFFVPIYSQASWKHESEASLVGSGGNTDTKSFSAKQKTTYEFNQKNLVSFDAEALYATADEDTNARSWGLGLRYDRILNERFSLFLGNSWSGNKFAGTKHKMNIDLGSRYQIFPEVDKEYWWTDFGYRYTDELTVEDVTIISHYLRVATEAKKNITKSASAKLFVEALPDISDISDFILKFELSLQNKMNENFALKVGYGGEYDAEPSKLGLKKFDYYYKTALVANF